MKSALSRSVLGRRVVPGTVLALAAASLSLGFAGPANAANTIELQGTVTGASGAALENVDVVAYNATTGDYLDDVLTDATGHYQFDTDLVTGSVKVQFRPDNTVAQTVTLSSPLPYQTRWSGGSRYMKGAAITTTSVDPATAPVVNANLPQYAAITGTVRVGADGHIPTDSSGAWADDTDENYVVWDGYTDAATGTYRIIVDPVSALRVGGYASDTSVNYLSQYWQDADTMAEATPVSVAAGQTLTGINFRLTNALRARQAPSIAGYPTVGVPLTANPGTWTRKAGTEFSYLWQKDGQTVGTAATYTPTAADFGKKLTLVVTALNGEFTGQSTTVTSDVVKFASTVKGKAKRLKGHKVRFAVKVVSANQKRVKGKVVVLRGTKVVHKAVKLVKGKAVILVKGQPKGKQTFTVHFKGNKKLAQVDKTFTVRVRK